ncbi:MAG: PTS lactose/cellobiose transporter subunit IIA [Lachnospiraceae bacterium]|nr:PTS lactose/cellobiose transporter subunit IIA [Lachnospiraceae bacterium]
MENANMLELSMSLIAGAGDAKSDSMEAIMLAKEGKFQEAKSAIQRASDGLQSTHEIQTQLIRDEMTGNPHEVTLLMVHAQDHLNGALMMRDLAEEFVHLYEVMSKKGEC